MKLTNSIRQAIRNALIERKQANRRKCFDLDEDTVAQKVYNRLFDEDARRKIAAVPHGWLPSVNRVWVNIGVPLHSDGSEDEIAHEESNSLAFINPRFVPECNRHPTLSLPADDPLAQEVIEIQGRRDALAREKTKLREKIDATLAVYQTKKQLLEGWPEVARVAERFLHEPAKAAGNFIVPAPAELNAELELP